jgi:hypothetical protein
MMSVRHSRLSSCTFYGGGGCVCSIHDHMSVQTWGGELRECSNVNEQHNTAPDNAIPDLPWVQQNTGFATIRIWGTSRNDGFGELPRTTTSDRPDLVYKPTQDNFPGIDTRPCKKMRNQTRNHQTEKAGNLVGNHRMKTTVCRMAK